MVAVGGHLGNDDALEVLVLTPLRRIDLETAHATNKKSQEIRGTKGIKSRGYLYSVANDGTCTVYEN